MASRPSTIGIIGGGFSGSLLAVHLLRQGGADDRVYLFERGGKFGRGLAYATGNPEHLLNVRAGNMSAFPDQPLHFVEWLDNRYGEEESGGEVRPHANTFVPRQRYGAYIQSLLGNELWGEGGARRTYLVNDEVVDIQPSAGGLTVVVAGGRTFNLDIAVLATGNPPPDRAEPGYFGDPWDPQALNGLERDFPVLLIGTGLTMVDMVISLLKQGHRGPIYAVSRRGLLPRRHGWADGPWTWTPPPGPHSVTTLLRVLRAEIAAARRAGVGWRSVIDAVRPYTAEIWGKLPLDDKRRFLRHLRPWWDAHRHRMAPSVANTIDHAVTRGQLMIRAGRIEIIDRNPAGIAVNFRPKGGGQASTLLVERIINCSGPKCDYTALDDPLFRNLLARGLIRPDPLRLGIDVTATGAVIGADGDVVDRLYALGPLTRGRFWEITAVPDIRWHCQRLADHLYSVVDDLPLAATAAPRVARART